MKRFFITTSVLFIAAGCAQRAALPQEQSVQPQQEKGKTMITVTSPAFKEGDSIPVQFTCQGENVNPELSLSGVPQEAESLALIMDDPDAPSGTFTHWVVWNIPASTAAIYEDSVPQGAVEGNNSAGRSGYMGPCPPSGTHRYFFKVYALDTLITAPEGSPREVLEQEMEGHIIEEGQLMGTFTH